MTPLLRGATLVATSATIVLVVAVAAGWTRAIDERLLAALRLRAAPRRDCKPAKLATAGRDLTALGGDALRLLFVVGCAAALVADRRVAAAGALIVVVAVARLALFGLKRVVRRPRPPAGEAGVVTYTSSFPSGHTFMAVVVYLSAAILVPVGMPSAVIATAVASALAVSLAIGTMRVSFGVHWPSDVIVGWVAGIAWTGASLIVVLPLA